MNLVSGFQNLNKYLINVPMKNYITKRNFAVRKRFYKQTGILQNDGKYEITLDQRKLKTLKGSPFVVSSEPLALAVAAEWNAQKQHIQQDSMHLSTLCNTAIDNPNNLSAFELVQYITNYLDTDTLLFQSSESDELYKLQVNEWDTVIQWFCDHFQADLQKCRNMGTPIIDDKTKGVLSKHLLSYSSPCIHGFVFGVDALKSVILTLACVERFLTPEKAALLSRLEEEFQLGKWGRVEWAHDLNQQDSQARISAAILFIHFNSSSWLTRAKLAL